MKRWNIPDLNIHRKVYSKFFGFVLKKFKILQKCYGNFVEYFDNYYRVC